MCEQGDEIADDEFFARLKEKEERFWGKRLKMPEQPPRWPPKHDVLNFRIGQKIRARRSWAYVYQGDLARAVGISQSALSRIEKGECKIGLVVLIRIAELLETTPEALMDVPRGEAGFS